MAAALERGVPVVALETSIVAQGLPAPHNLAAALGCEAAVREGGAIPAATAVIGGEVRLGLDRSDLELLANPDARVAKLSSRDLGWGVSSGRPGATTVAATLRVAALAGVRFMATGGIGGVHRSRPGRPEDASGDLHELARSPVACFCAGAKMILDVPATLERLESLGVPVLGYGCDEFPAFYTSRSGRPVPVRVDTPREAARALYAGWAAGSAGALVVIPPPEELLGAAGLVEQALAATAEIDGPEATPAALTVISELSGGRSLEVNLKLVVNNARLAAESAAAYASLPEKEDAV